MVPGHFFVVIVLLLLPFVELLVDIFLALLCSPVAVIARTIIVTLPALSNVLNRLLRAQVSVVALHVASEAGHMHIVQLRHRIEKANLIQSLLADFGLLAIRRLMAFLTTPVTDDLNSGWPTIQIRARLIEVRDLAFIDPILLLGKSCHDSQF